MSQGSSNPASPSRPVSVSDQQETVTPVSHIFSLSEVSASFEALNIDVEGKPNVGHRAQTSYSPGASRTPGSPSMWGCGLIQEVAIEAGHAVTEIPTWMGLTTKWRVKCVSLAEAKDILAGCKRLEQEN